MRAEDLPRVSGWLQAPHVARWFLAGSSVERELDDLRKSMAGEQAVHLLVALDDQTPIGWCQWYPCSVEPAWANDIGAAADDVGIDYAIGEVDHVGRGVGTALIARLVQRLWESAPGCAIVADPEEGNVASRRVLEKNGFELLSVRSIPSERTDDPVAIYRLPSGPPARESTPSR